MPGSASQFDTEGSAAPSGPKKIALLVGNSAYPGRRLANPINDVRLLERTLRLLDFDVEVEIDATKARLETAIVRFGERIEQAGAPEASFFYFAGHGVQYQGSNYLLPVDAEIPATRYLRSGAVKVDAVVEELARKSTEANIVVLDACRNNPIPDAYSSTRDVTQGLAGIHNVPRRTLVAFSTAAGAVALDGDGQNSPYATILASKLALPNRWVLDIFGEVNDEVETRTNGKQSPAMFMQGAPPRIVLRPMVAEARTMVEEPVVPEAQAHQGRQHVVILTGDGRVGSGVRAFLAGNGVHEYFKDSDAAPGMVVLPAGAFTMGESDDGAASSNEKPAHTVTFARPFAVGRCAVTVAEFRAFVEATGHKTLDTIYTIGAEFLGFGDLVVRHKAGRNWRRPGYRQGDDHPVVGVSWQDARAYVAWLATLTGKPYRLLSEAEWEYAARARSMHRYAWGQVITRARANFDENPELRRRNPMAWRYNARRGTCPVEHFEPNAWGLFNMHGNVAEWVEDDWHETYEGAPDDGSARVSPGSDKAGGSWIKVVRGGSWNSSASDVRSAARAGNFSENGASWIGFRVARDLADIG
jgi:formylglycine-generating enzyme required for sulfatase activity